MLSNNESSIEIEDRQRAEDCKDAKEEVEPRRATGAATAATAGTAATAATRRLLTSTSTLSCDSAEFDDAFGLLIRLTENEPCNSDANITDNANDVDNPHNVTEPPISSCTLQFVPDRNFPHIHPHVYCPDDWEGLTRLGGGGSGAAVFKAHAPQLDKDLVLKHGGYKDLTELFALATIAQQLQVRGGIAQEEVDVRVGGIHHPSERELRSSETHQVAAALAARSMQARIPRFECIYISPRHLRDRSQGLWDKLRKIIRYWSDTNIAAMDKKRASSEGTKSTASATDDSSQVKSENESKNDDPPTHRRSMLYLDQFPPLPSGFWDPTNSVRLRESSEDMFQIELEGSDLDSIAFCFGPNSFTWLDNKTIRLHGPSYFSLEGMVRQLLPMMHDRLFKFTLGQRSIGGPSPQTGNSLLYDGLLRGPLLESFLDMFLQTIRDLQQLTRAEEVDIVESLRQEVHQIETGDVVTLPDDISAEADTFVGKAIKKNFRRHGRIDLLHDLGAQFREGGASALVLMEDEKFPAKLLGDLLRPGALMGDSFQDVPMEPTTMQFSHLYWRNLLSRAVGKRRKSSALQRIWTCGLTDAGIHNLFFNHEKKELQFFDLGEPELQSVPGFLTKFLFSFFHTLGMQEDDDGHWIRRFERKGDKLALTPMTLDLLPKAFSAFGRALDRLIEELFDGDDSLRWLLIQYVTLQLLSDTAFCLQRWQVKGGGRSRAQNHHTGIDKWLWRALWDVYIAYNINTQESWSRLSVEHPLHQASSMADDESI